MNFSRNKETTVVIFNEEGSRRKEGGQNILKMDESEEEVIT